MSKKPVCRSRKRRRLDHNRSWRCMPPSHTSLSRLQVANYRPARGKVVLGVPCFRGPHGRGQPTARAGPRKHATLAYFSFPLASSYLVRLFLTRGARSTISLIPPCVLKDSHKEAGHAPLRMHAYLVSEP